MRIDRIEAAPGLKTAVAVTGLLAAVILLIAVVPAPLRTVADGVIIISDESVVRARADGFLVRIVTQPGTKVRSGETLLVCKDPLLSARVRTIEAQLMELHARRDAVRQTDTVEAKIFEEEIAYREKSLAGERQNLEDLTLRSETAGVFVIPRAADLPERFVRKGDLLGYVLNPAAMTARVVIPQESIDLVRSRTRDITLRLAERLGTPLPAELRREVPAASRELPSPALATEGGGNIATDPGDANGLSSFQSYFQLDLEIPATAGAMNVGSRVFVRFDHGWEPLGARWYRSLRQLFLNRFNA